MSNTNKAQISLVTFKSLKEEINSDKKIK